MPVVNALQSAPQGYPCLTIAAEPRAPQRVSRRSVSRPSDDYLVIDGEYIWKYTHKAYDFSVLGNTPITYPDRVGRARRFPAMRFAPACRTSTA